MQKKINFNPNSETYIKKKRNSLRFFFFLVVFILICGLIAAFACFNWYKNNLKAPSVEQNFVKYEVKEGDNLQKIAYDLENQGVIKSELALKIYLRLNNLNPQIKAGVYDLPTNKPLEEIIELLENGVFTTNIKITIIEGIKSEDIAEIIDTKMQASGSDYSFNKEEFMDIVLNPDSYKFSVPVQNFLNEFKPQGKPLRGFLYPDTYFLDTNMTNIEIIEFFIQNFIQKVNSNITSDMYETDEISNLYDALILASIIEKEASFNDDKTLISGVFHNRLRYGYVLGADSTINFLTNQTSENLNTQIESPYNTYKNLGLPPTPIGNPQIDSIIAAIKPQNTNYFFFFHDEYGNTYYSETDGEHLVKVCQIRGCN